jgi:hypothetical protein
VEGEALLPAALEELSTALEELRVAEEQVQVQHEQLSEVRTSIQAQRDHYRDLFELAPAAYLIAEPEPPPASSPIWPARSSATMPGAASTPIEASPEQTAVGTA